MLFVNLPPVLQLQLKRFEYDFQRDTMVKVRGLQTQGCRGKREIHARTGAGQCRAP